MPRWLLLGDGGLTALFDADGCLRDLFAPGPGSPNHAVGGKFRFGIWADDRFAWLDRHNWDCDIRFEPESGAGVVTYSSESWGLKLSVRHWIDTLQATLFAEVAIESASPREAKVFWAEDLRINETDIGDTALYVEATDEVVHFKGSLGVAFGADAPIAQYACGIKGFGGAEGAWRDAEDGHLSGNPIAQGSVDAAFGVRMNVQAGVRATTTFYAQIVDSPFAPSVRIVERDKPSASSKITPMREGVWSELEASLPSEAVQLARSSVRLALSHAHSEGALLASLDSEVLETNRAHYAHCWMRDGSQVTASLANYGLTAPRHRFLEFCARTLNPARPAFLQKYLPSGDLASTWHPWTGAAQPIQEDETAWVTLLAAQMAANNELSAELMDRLLWPTATFLLEFVREDGLPKPSYDLWEERFGVHTNTVGVVIAALSAVSELDDARAANFASSAARMRAAVEKGLIDPNSGRLWRGLDANGVPDETVDAAVLQQFLLGVIDPNGPIADATLAAIESKLLDQSPLGGVARYESDYYFRTGPEAPPNPWVLTTLWYAQIRMLRATTLSELDAAKRWIEWTVDRAFGGDVLAEQYHAYSGEPLAVAPLAWSHAEYLNACLCYARKRASFAANATKPA